MTTKYLLPKARNLRTGESVKQQDLTGARFQLSQRDLCQQQANRLAEELSARSGDSWLGYVVEYLPTQRSR